MPPLRRRTTRGEGTPMAHDYSIDLGFDLDSNSKDPAYAGFLELSCEEGGSLSSLDKLKKDGTLTFAVYDTSEGSNSGRGTPTSLTVTFAAADQSSPATSPFA